MCSSRSRLSLPAAVVLLLGATMIWVGVTPQPAEAQAIAVNQCNYDETGAAREIRCDVTVVNTLDHSAGFTSSTVTTTVCAGPPGEALCVTTPETTTTDIVNTVNQCNNSVNAAGSIVTCNVTIVNNIIGLAPIPMSRPVTVNQCIGSGQGGGTEPTTNCNPRSAVSGADVIQCNTSGNDGGASERVRCSVPTSTTIVGRGLVTVVQCNDSANGGGGLVTCTAQITTNYFPREEPTTPAGSCCGARHTAPTTAVPATTVPVRGTTAVLPRTGSTSSELVVAGLLLVGLGGVAMAAARRRVA